MKTKHARVRMQQRGIPELLVDLLQRFGVRHWSAGATLLYFDKRARRKADSYTGGMLSRAGKWSNAYLVMGSDGSIITVGHRHARVKN